MSSRTVSFVLLVSMCSMIVIVTFIEAAMGNGERMENFDGASSLRFTCGQHCQKKILFGVSCDNGEASVTRFDHSVSDWIDKLQDKITKLSRLFDNSSEGSGMAAMDVISSIEDQVTSLEEKIDRLFESLGVPALS